MPGSVESGGTPASLPVRARQSGLRGETPRRPVDGVYLIFVRGGECYSGAEGRRFESCPGHHSRALVATRDGGLLMYSRHDNGATVCPWLRPVIMRLACSHGKDKPQRHRE